MPTSRSGGRLQFNIAFNTDKSSLNTITQSLQNIQKEASNMSSRNPLKEGFDKAAQSARQLQSIIDSSWNSKLNQLNLDKLNQSIKQSYGGINELKASLQGAGAAGDQAFYSLASSVLNTNMQLKESNKLLDDMATSMANTIKWGITSSVFNNMTGAIQKAFYFTKDLDRSLTNIRIVTGESADQMQRFAEMANSSAKELGRTTLDYTHAALTFYQQGLDDQQVQARTEAVLKAQNITGIGSEMADYLTAVWNGFKVNANEITSYVDKLAAVADNSASDMSQLAIALSKVSSTANVMGVDMDQLTAQIATVVATTRQAPESVGTAFKTIYSRLNDIKAGADDAEVSLGNYSGKMAELGFNVLDANGKLRDTGQVMEEIGSRWSILSKEQQVTLAQVMGGMRQVNQLVSLFDNWTMYSNMLNVSLESQGTLNEKNARYLQSVQAHMKTLTAETERTYQILSDTEALNTITDILTKTVSLFNDFIKGIGGGTTAIVYFGSTVANLFSKQISNAIIQATNNFKNFISNFNS